MSFGNASLRLRRGIDRFLAVPTFNQCKFIQTTLTLLAHFVLGQHHALTPSTWIALKEGG